MTAKPFGPFRFSGNRYITGPDRFSETIGEKPTHTVAVAEMRFPTQTVAFADESDMRACGHLLAAAPELAEAAKRLRWLAAELAAGNAFSPGECSRWADEARRALDKAEGRADA